MNRVKDYNKLGFLICYDFRNQGLWMEHIYNINEIKDMIKDIAFNYGVERIILFGSYATGDANSTSDIDLRIDKGRIRDYIELSSFSLELEKRLNKNVDVLTTGSLSEKFLRNISKEEIIIYEQ